MFDFDIEMAAGLSAEFKIEIKETDKEPSHFAGGSYFFISSSHDI